jgi:hypothetical protein
MFDEMLGYLFAVTVIQAATIIIIVKMLTKKKDK